ncbi:MAG: GGDEF domain-containing protein [Candidatus Tectomicrobia bacterium]|uniref:diguanylate cyclase n=1 Tax=Tectimicrobiota bacterium TaxID=2528274 RepID=A0A932FWN7_UNCTE|nr:GGDEF domain-containing protein [Candidatus Tectomicrobia bacterium]
MFDRITGVLKKEVFEYLLEKEVARATRYPFSFSLAMIELDRTSIENSMVNGRSHRAKERQADLKTLGNLLRIELRKSDILGCEQGGVFCWIMPETDEQGAQIGGERIRKAVEGFGFNGRRRTVSLGIATFPTQSLDLPDMLQKSKTRLTQAQSQGGNQICISDGASFFHPER